MNIQTLINNAKKKKDLVAIDIFNKILNISKEYHISINNAITYLLMQNPSTYNKKILMVCRSIYPIDNTTSLNFLNNSGKVLSNSIINISKPTVKPTKKEKLGCNINDIKKKRKPKNKESTTIETEVGKLEIG